MEHIFILKYEDIKKFLREKSSKSPRIWYLYYPERIRHILSLLVIPSLTVSISIMRTTAIAEIWSLSSYIYVEDLNLV